MRLCVKPARGIYASGFRVLMERPDLGRSEGFARTRLPGAHAPGEIVEARIGGHKDGELLAEAT